MNNHSYNEKYNSRSRIEKLTLTALFTAIAVVGSMFSFPIFGSKCAPVQHLVNVLCAVTVGPWWGLGQAFLAALIRNLTGLGSPLAFPGSMCGALLGGLLYRYGKKLPFAYIGEVFGTGIIGGMLSYPVASLIMGNQSAALFTFVVPFLVSTCGGTVLAAVITIRWRKWVCLLSCRTEKCRCGWRFQIRKYRNFCRKDCFAASGNTKQASAGAVHHQCGDRQ